MDDRLTRRIGELQAALGVTRMADLSGAHAVGSWGTGIEIKFSHETDAELANHLRLVVHSIGCLKDNLDAWCARQGKPLVASQVLLGSPAAAIVQDLWNEDKHDDLNPPKKGTWSGSKPKVVDLGRSVRYVLTAGDPSDGDFPGLGELPPDVGVASAGFRFDILTGAVTHVMSPGTTAEVQLSGEVVDENSRHLGWLLPLLEGAVKAWTAAIQQAGASR